ncbi:MAG TPA: chromosome segregation protein SMC [Cyclobacteriaceae bacterium]|nr:chromosome segregation protein SMC [Cyclobacteriaceae bacterium]
MTEQKDSTQKKSKGNKMLVIVSLLAIIVIVQGIKIYFDHNEKISVSTQLTETEEDLATTLQRLNEIRDELAQKITELEKLGGDISDLEKAKVEVERELRSTRDRNNRAIRDLKDKVEGYEELLLAKDEEITKLTEINKSLLTENVQLKTQRIQLSDSIRNIAKNKDELASKVAIASQLKVENINIVALNDKGRERPSPFRSRQLERLRIDFNIAENNVAPIEGKSILLRIIDENGQVLFDVTRGSGTFMYEGKETFYTVKQEILFDNTKQKLSFVYEKGSDYPTGTYYAEIFTDGYKMGTEQFVVR